MLTLLHHLVTETQAFSPDAKAIVHNKSTWTYAQLSQLVEQQARALQSLNLQPQQRVAVCLPKQIETVSSFLAISMAGGVFVPVNPALKAAQVAYILGNCNVNILITSKNRLPGLAEVLTECPDLQAIVITEADNTDYGAVAGKRIISWQRFLAGAAATLCAPATIDTDVAAILYTSGSTGKPKGVVLSHRNLVAGAVSVSQYLAITAADRLLAVLPFSFDYGLNQLTTALLKGATCVLLDYLLPRDVVVAMETYQITGLAAVPPLWAQLANVSWPDSINGHLRYLTNSGGKMPKAILANIRTKAPDSRFFLMYGLTEAFRSTYLPPEQLDLRPDSIGKAIPNAEILVVRPDGSLCNAHEPGELVHRGSLVALGYWNDPVATAERFKPAPGQNPQLPLTEIAVWSGDTVIRDEEGYLYFVGRKDDMIKTSGYRVSPTEIEEVVYASALVREAVAFGVAHPILGQVIVVVVATEAPSEFDSQALVAFCKANLPNFMVPAHIEALLELPRNANGKIDRQALAAQFATLFPRLEAAL